MEETLVTLPVIDRALFFDPDGIHGVSHTERVLIHARTIVEAVGGEPWQAEALELAALWHDIGRTHNGADYFHGARSHAKARTLKLHAGTDPDIADIAFLAIEQHCTNDLYTPDAIRLLARRIPYRSADIEHVWKMLKDADALDRVRLGGWEAPDVDQLRFDFSRGQVAFAAELLRSHP